MRQLVSMRYMLSTEEEKVTVQEIKNFFEDHINKLIDEKKSKFDKSTFTYFVLDQEAYLDYELKCAKHLLDAYKIEQFYSGSIDDKNFGNKAELTVVNKLLTTGIPELNYVSNSAKNAIIFVVKIVESSSEEKFIRSLTESKSVMYAKYYYE